MAARWRANTFNYSRQGGSRSGPGMSLRKAEVRCQRLEASEGCALAREYF